MRISLNYDIKVLQIWCTREEADKENFDEYVRELFNTMQLPPKYKTVVYISGTRDLTELTCSLLRHNSGDPTKLL